MNKTEYIIRQIAKTNKKNYENYVVTRIWHLLDNLDIKFVTQQHVSSPDKRALTDMYFPQLKIHIEVDEGHHFDSGGERVHQDAVREADIINATGHELIRIKVSDMAIEEINEEIDKVVKTIKTKFDSISPTPWDIEAEYNPQTYIDRGSISVDDNVAFRTIADACNCFGHSYSGFQRGFTRHPKEERMLWFPKLYANNDWENEISLDENEIYEKNIKDQRAYFEKYKNDPDQSRERLVFARARSNLGDVMYRFKGVYKLDFVASDASRQFVYKRTEKSVKTYRSLK